MCIYIYIYIYIFLFDPLALTLISSVLCNFLSGGDGAAPLVLVPRTVSRSPVCQLFSI